MAQSAFAYRDLGTTIEHGLRQRQRQRLEPNGRRGLDLIRLRTAANGAISKVALDTAGRVIVRSDFAGTQVSSLVSLAPGWNRVELCGSNISGGGDVGPLPQRREDRERVGRRTRAPSPVGRIQIGDTANKTWTANFDDVQVDQFVGEVVVAPDTAGPTTPGQPTGSSPSSG